MAKPTVKRCAIYTRKSSEEGLEKEYNSLDAQRDAAEAFVRSQKHEGWRTLKRSYDDGGISGGHMDRPGLQELIKDIRANQVDIVVVYKVDRLSRSLADFAKLMELFDQYGVSFVSVTQQFNTSTSMGRLTLNVLLSFAQFEREVTGERIRDKIALSKKKGKWMGGVPPLGYDVVDCKLKINASEANMVRECFHAYLYSTGLLQAVQEINRRGLKTKSHVSAKGRVQEAKPWIAKQLHRLLNQPLYLGKVRYRNELFDGEHEPIIDQETWDRVQNKLRESQPEYRKIQGHRNELAMDRSMLIYPLKGSVYSMDGDALSPTYTNKRSRLANGTKERKRYRYYVSQKAIQIGDRSSSVTSLNAKVLESAVQRMIAAGLPQLGDWVAVDDYTSRQVQHRLKNHAARISSLDSAKDFAELIHLIKPKIVVAPEALQIHIPKKSLAALVASPIPNQNPSEASSPIDVNIQALHDEVILDADLCLSVRQGKSTLLHSRTGEPVCPKVTTPNPALIRIIAQAEYWRTQLEKYPDMSLAAILRPRGIQTRYVGKVLNAAYLSPTIKRAILQGTQPMSLQVKDLLIPRSLDWNVQLRELGFSSGQ